MRIARICVVMLMTAVGLPLSGVSTRAQPAPSTVRDTRDAPLFRTIAALDAELFGAYNRCDLERFGSFFTEELEFYHDNGGLTDRTRESLVESVRKNICGKVRRHLVPESLEVFPLHGYGAVETGVHRFSHPGRDDAEPQGEARFVMLWQVKDDEWKVTRVISYDHRAVK